jgi:hypothetical protein
LISYQRDFRLSDAQKKSRTRTRTTTRTISRRFGEPITNRRKEAEYEDGLSSGASGGMKLSNPPYLRAFGSGHDLRMTPRHELFNVTGELLASGPSIGFDFTRFLAAAPNSRVGQVISQPTLHFQGKAEDTLIRPFT